MLSLEVFKSWLVNMLLKGRMDEWIAGWVVILKDRCLGYRNILPES
jgi:hypothetical protein